MFQHANVRTPRWLGYLVQRPENNALHHERGVHAWNYGNIALWDQLRGTWRNPATWDAKAGFFDGASARLPEMLRGRDIAAAGPDDTVPAGVRLAA
jgi:sterol desaturase/sphingolipid hydroxylase (fatty acid hydroxylase superfamily)